MAVVLIEGFDHLTQAELQAKGWSNLPTSMQPGRFDGQCARLNPGGTSTANLQKQLPSTYSTIIMGAAIRAVSPTGLSVDSLILSSTLGSVNTLRLSLNAAGQIVVKNSGGTTIATGTTVLAANVWYYIEIKLVVGTSGTVEVHLNGAVEIASTVGNFGTVNIDSIQIQNKGSSTGVDFDDIYVLDTTGAAPRNTFLGDVRVETIYPTGDGAHTAWNPTGGGSHYTQVDEAQADGDTTYVSDGNPGDLDTYTFGDIDGGATVYGVQVNLYARKDDAATRQIAPVIRQAGADNVGSTVTLASSYVVYSQIYNQDPTAADWTPSTVNADEFGVKEIA